MKGVARGAEASRADRPLAVAAIQARTSSTRLPRKVLADLAGAPLVVRIAERLRLARRVERVLVLTSLEPSDDELAETCGAAGIEVRRGPLDDVLARYLTLLDELGPRYVARITGDAPCVAPEFVDAQIDALSAFDGDVVELAGGPCEGTLGGQGVISARALRSAAASSRDARDREHCASFELARRRADLRCVRLAIDPRYRVSGLRLAVDEAPDLALARAIFERFVPLQGVGFDLRDALDWLAREPSGTAQAAQNAGVAESQANRAHRALVAQARGSIVGEWP